MIAVTLGLALGVILRTFILRHFPRKPHFFQGRGQRKVGTHKVMGLKASLAATFSLKRSYCERTALECEVITHSMWYVLTLDPSLQ